MNGTPFHRSPIRRRQCTCAIFWLSSDWSWSVSPAGWYFGWYKLGVQSNDPNHPSINVDIDSNKIKQDLKKAEKSVEGVLTSQPVVPSELPPLPAPPAPPAFNPGGTAAPVTIPLPPPPSLPPLK